MAAEGRLPEAALRAVQARREEVIPALIQILRRGIEQQRAGERVVSDGPFLALPLLTDFRAKEALPILLESLALPDEGAERLFGDMATDCLARILAALAADTPEAIDSIVQNREISPLFRGIAAGAYLFLVRDGRLSREEAVERLRSALKSAIEERNGELATALMYDLADYAAGEAIEEIETAYRLNLVDSMCMDLEDMREAIAQGEERFRQELARCPPTGFEDTVAELRKWASFQPPEPPTPRSTPAPSARSTILEREPFAPGEAPAFRDEGVSKPIVRTGARVGRNDPCPCGSGKKFKKCHGGK